MTTLYHNWEKNEHTQNQNYGLEDLILFAVSANLILAEQA